MHQNPPQTSLSMAHSWHTQSELDTFLAHDRSPCLFELALCYAKKRIQTVVGRIHFHSLNGLGDFPPGGPRSGPPRVPTRSVANCMKYVFSVYYAYCRSLVPCIPNRLLR